MYAQDFISWVTVHTHLSISRTNSSASALVTGLSAVMMCIVVLCSSVHGFGDDSIDVTVQETSPQRIITIALNIKGTSPVTLSQYVFDIICLGSSSDVNIRVPGEL